MTVAGRLRRTATSIPSPAIERLTGPVCCSGAQPARAKRGVMTSIGAGRSCLLSLLVTAVALSSIARSQSDALQVEEVAAKYMGAFFHGDLSVAASLTHPETLARIKASFLEELRTATSGTGEPVTPADYGLSLTMREVVELEAEALYVAVLEADRSRDPVSAEAMRRATIEVIESREGPEGATIVRLRVVTPTSVGGSSAQEVGLLLRASGSEWKVVGNAP